MIRHGESNCPRCGREYHAIDVTQFGHAERHVIYDARCDCPQRRRSLCDTPVDQHDHCRNLDCCLLGHIVPILVVR